MSKPSTLPPTTLRDRLRADTRDRHERFDAAVSALDIGTARGLGDFLLTQQVALATMRCNDGPDRAEAEDVAGELAGALAQDIAALGRTAPDAVPDMGMPLLRVDATALVYILLGSRLGTQVMARHWREAAQGSAREAGHYLTLDPRRDAWRAFCARAGGEPATGPQADRIVADAGAIFDHYATALDRVVAASTEVGHV